MSEYDGIDRRFERMEGKIDKLVDAVTELVKVEVVLKAVEVRLNNHSEAIKEHDMRLDNIENKIPVYDLSTAILKKVGIIILTIVATGVLGGLFVFGG